MAERLKEMFGRNKKKISILGADNHGKTELYIALACHKIPGLQVDKQVAYLPWPHSIEDETIRKLLSRGVRIDLGCDPGMTKEGKDVRQRIRCVRAED